MLQSQAAVSGGATAEGVATRCLRLSEKASAVELLDLLGVFDSARAQTTAMIERLRRENSRVPAAYWSSFASGVTDHDTLVSIYAPIYLRHLSREDICALVSFYRTPLGTHYLHAAPQIQEATRDAAQTWATTTVLQLLQSGGEAQSADQQRASQRTAQTAPEDARTAAIHDLLRRSGDLATAEQSIVLALDRLREGSQQIALPPTFWADARKTLLSEDDLVRLWAPAYVRQFTDAEVHELLEFYRSGTGLRYAAALPAIEAERLEAGTQLGRDVAKRALREAFGPLPQWRLLHPSGPEAVAPNSQPGGNPETRNPP